MRINGSNSIDESKERHVFIREYVSTDSVFLGKHEYIIIKEAFLENFYSYSSYMSDDITKSNDKQLVVILSSNIDIDKSDITRNIIFKDRYISKKNVFDYGKNIPSDTICFEVYLINSHNKLNNKIGEFICTAKKTS